MIASPVPRESLWYVAKSLPAAPQILARLGQTLQDLDAGLDDIVEVLRPDGALTAHIIRIANSAMYNSGLPFASLEDALARVGLSEAYRLTGFGAVEQLSDRNLGLYGITGVQLRENSLLTALIMEQLARAAGLNTRVAYTAGLLRSIGKIALDRLTRDRANATGGLPRGISGVAEWESGVVGLNNCEAAGIILESWRFPMETVMAILEHYTPGPKSGPLASLLNLAAGAAERAGHGLPGELPYWETPAPCFAATGLDARRVEDSMRVALIEFGPIRAALG
jgi:HD-like signal output (HDOD) protein